MAMNGPKGILLFLDIFFMAINVKPTIDVRIEDKIKVTQTPLIPVNDPIIAIRSKSPSPIPCCFFNA